MKHILLSLTTLITFSVFAQNTSVKIISKETGSVLNGTTHTIKAWHKLFEIKEEFKAVYADSDSMLIGIKREEVQIIPGTQDFYCWYLCYNAVDAGTRPVWVGDDSLMMYEDDTISNFSVYMWPNGESGTAEYRYVFYPENNPSDSSWLNIVFNPAYVGIEDVDQIEINAFPNPVMNTLNVSIPVDMGMNRLQFELRDVTGRLVLNGKLQSGNNALEVGNTLDAGSYILRVLKGDEVLLNEQILKK